MVIAQLAGAHADPTFLLALVVVTSLLSLLTLLLCILGHRINARYRDIR